MDCEQYQSLPMDERSPEDQLAIELAKVLYPPILYRNEAELIHLRPNNGADVLDAMQSSN